MNKYEQDIANEDKFLELLSNAFSNSEEGEVLSLSYFGNSLKVYLVPNGEWHHAYVLRSLFEKFKHRFNVVRSFQNESYSESIVCSANALSQLLRSEYTELVGQCMQKPEKVTETEIESLEEMHSIIKTLIGFSMQLKTE